MKKLSIIILFIIGFISQNLFAQAVNSKGRLIDSKGDVYIDGTKLGSITMDSIVKNANGKPMAFLKSGGVLVNSKGKMLGRMGKTAKLITMPTVRLFTKLRKIQTPKLAIF